MYSTYVKKNGNPRTNGLKHTVHKTTHPLTGAPLKVIAIPTVTKENEEDMFDSDFFSEGANADFAGAKCSGKDLTNEVERENMEAARANASKHLTKMRGLGVTWEELQAQRQLLDTDSEIADEPEVEFFQL